MTRLLSVFTLVICLCVVPSWLAGESDDLQKALEEAKQAALVQSERNAALSQKLTRTQARLKQLQETLADQERSIESLRANLGNDEISDAGPRHEGTAAATPQAPPSSQIIHTSVAVFGLMVGATFIATFIVLRRRFAGAGTHQVDTTHPSSALGQSTPQQRPFGGRVKFSTALALLYIPTGLVRGMMISLLPLQALELLGSAQKVSVMYLFVGIGGITIVLTLPRLSRRFGSRRVFDFGVVCTIVSMSLLPFVSTVTFFVGMLLQIVAIASFEIAMMLFLMASLKRDEYKFFEPYRVVCSAAGFVVGPVGSIYLRENVAENLPFALTGLFALVAWAYVRYLRVGEVGPSSTSFSANPLAYIQRFFSQPRLALAYTLSIGRYSWWVMFFIYVPIYAASTELGPLIGGLLVSVGSAATWLAPIWGRIGRHYGLRNLFTTSVLGAGLLTLLAFATAGAPTVCAAVLILAAVMASLSDGASHVPFYRSTRAHERTEMAGVYATHRDIGQLLPPTIFAFVLKFLPLPVVFLTGGLIMLVMTPLCRYLPRRM